MRFKHTTKKNYHHGDIRVIKKFLFLPLRINNETRWLETACVVQFRVDKYDSLFGEYYHEWRNEAFYNMCVGDYCPMCQYGIRKECEVRKEKY